MKRKIVIFTLFIFSLLLAATLLYRSNSNLSMNCNAKDKACWFDEVRMKVRNEGLLSAFNLVTSIYTFDSSFRSECHVATHIIGEEAYRLFTQNKNISFFGEISHCGLGFYHGFMQEMLISEKSYVQAGKFCSKFASDKKLNTSMQNNIIGACFHGIGHGLSEIELEKNIDISLEEFLTKLVPICEEVADSEENDMRCVSGVYNTLALIINDPRYKFKLDKSNPYAICQNYLKSTNHKKACYQQMNTYVIWASSGDFKRALKLAFEIYEKEYIPSAMDGVIAMAARNSITENKDKNVCDEINEVNYKISCIKSFVSGLIEFGRPGKEYEKAIIYCNNLSNGNKSECFQFLGKILNITYNLEESEQICHEFPSLFRAQCLDTQRI